MEESIVREWDKRADEPEEWYRIFRDYFLPLGNRRTVRNAFEFFVRVEQPAHYDTVDPDDIRMAPTHWADYANKYEWGKRALAYDESNTPDLSDIYVTTVLEYLKSNATTAAKALVDALKNERTRVQAANSILNRAGVPETSEILLKGGVSVNSDDMAAATNKVEEWKTRNKSG
jgi:hypothetical protein